jgi:endonuclease YncB( thermonuclease family)
VSAYGNSRTPNSWRKPYKIDGTNVNHTLVKGGWCWWYRKYAPGDRVLEGLEAEARAGRKGLWADPHPVPRWVYTNARRGQSLDLSDLVASTENPFVMGEERLGYG